MENLEKQMNNMGVPPKLRNDMFTLFHIFNKQKDKLGSLNYSGAILTIINDLNEMNVCPYPKFILDQFKLKGFSC